MKRMIALATLAVASTAFAEGAPVKSQFFYQTEAQKQQVTPELSYQSSTTKFTGGTKQELTGQILNVKYEYGLSEAFSLGGKLGYQTAKDETTGSPSTDNKGMTDLVVYGRGKYALTSDSALNYGADLNMSPGAKKNEANGDTTAMTGTTKLTPYVGYTIVTGNNTCGVKLNTQVALTDGTTKTDTGATTVTTKTKGGDTTALTGFYEYGFEKGLVGGSLSWFGMNTTKSTTSGATTNTSGVNGWQLAVYPVYKVTETAEVLGNLTYTNITTKKIAAGNSVVDLDGANQLTLQVGGRFTF